MNLSINSKFGNRPSQTSLSPSQGHSIQMIHPSQQLIEIIEQYQQAEQFNEETETEKQQGHELNNGASNNISDVFMSINARNDTKPVRMFKDQMELKKQNFQKKIIVKELQQINKKLKMQYDISLNNNKKMELFLKQIQFTFKNDRSNQKANQTLLKATKTLHREEIDSKNYIQKLIKSSKTNQMRQLKAYLKILKVQKNRLSQMLKQELSKNEKLRKTQDFNSNQLQTFHLCQSQLTKLLQQHLQQTANTRQKYKKQKFAIKISLNYKQIEYTKRQVSQIDKLIAKQLLKKEGLQYEIEVIKNKMKQKNKRNLKQEGSLLKQQIKNKRKKIIMLNQQLKQKIKTQQYITKWTKQLKNKFKDLEKDHGQIKQKYKQQINKLSSEIQQWNRMYKVELIEQQNTNKKQATKENEGNKQNTCGDRKIRVVKIYQVQRLSKQIMFHIVQNDYDGYQFLKQNILGFGKYITLKQLHRRLCDLDCLEEEDQDQIFKLARYIIQDNNNVYTRINLQEAIQTNIAYLIFKNLLNTDLNSVNIPLIKSQLKDFLSKNFDTVRHQIWLASGKSTTFSIVNLKFSLSKFVKQEQKILKYIQLIQYLLWKKFGQVEPFKIHSYEKLCEDILGKKLVKDNQNRISRTTIRSVFDKVYNQNIDSVNEESS